MKTIKKSLSLLLSVTLSYHVHAQWSGDSLNDIRITYASPVQPTLVKGQQIISDGHDGAYMAWTEKNNGVDFNVFVQHVGATGYLLWNNVAVSAGSLRQEKPWVIRDSYNNLIVAWQDSASGNYDIYAQKYNWNGQPLWTTGGILVASVPGNSSQQDVSGCTDGSGGAIITWRDYRNGTAADIYAQRLDVNGIQQWGTAGIAICTAGGDQAGKVRQPGAPVFGDPVFIISDNSGGAYLVWSDGRSGIHVYGQRVDGNGTAYWTTNGKRLESQSSFYWGAWSIANSDNNNFIFAYSNYKAGSNTSNNPSPNSYVTKIDQNGNPLWGANGQPLNPNTAAYDSYPDIDSDGQGGALVAFWFALGANFHIYASKLDATGNFVWGTSGIDLSHAGGSNLEQCRPRIKHDGNGGAIITWLNDKCCTSWSGNACMCPSYSIYQDVVANCINAAGVLSYPVTSAGASGFTVMGSVSQSGMTGDTIRIGQAITKEGGRTIVESLSFGSGQSSTATNRYTIQAIDQCQIVDPNTIEAYFYFSSLCLGDSTVFINQSLGSPASWNWNFSDPASGASNTSSLADPKHVFSALGSYSVTLVITSGALQDTVTIPVNIGTGGGGSINAGNDATICAGSSITLNAAGGSDYSWSPSASLSNPTVSAPFASPTATTTYTLSGISLCGTTTDQVTLFVSPNTLSSSITQSGAMLTANISGASYQWIDCNNGNTAILGATNQSYTAATNGSYAVTITQNGCSNTSPCVNITGVGITQPVLSEVEGGVRLFPNPTNSQVNLLFDHKINNAAIKLINITGQTVMEETDLMGDKFLFDISSQAKGFYFIEVNEAGSISRVKLVKQ